MNKFSYFRIFYLFSLFINLLFSQNLRAESYDSHRIHSSGRVVAIGDIHGDLDALKRALRLAGAINHSDDWIGGTLIIVQTGDQIDRGEDDRAVLDFLEELTPKAEAANGHIILLNGNHELMNVALEMNYVVPAGFKAFENVVLPEHHLTFDELNMEVALSPRKTPGVLQRAYEFMPGGNYARILAKRPILIIVDDTVFVHGGITAKHIRDGLMRLDKEIRDWMMSKTRPEKTPSWVWPKDENDSPVWNRVYSESIPSVSTCAELDTVFSELKVKRMVVGHSIQKNQINSVCEDRVWRTDIGMSKYFYSKDKGSAFAQVLEIKGSEVTVLKEDSTVARQNQKKTLRALSSTKKTEKDRK